MNELTSFMQRLCDEAQLETLPRFRADIDIDNKLDEAFDPVTEGDRKAEQVIRAMINKEHPDHGILGEEYGAENLDANHIWIIDPIDGTRVFISGIPVWGTLIGLAVNGRMEQGIMHQPFTGERFYSDGLASWYLGPGVTSPKPLRCRKRTSLADALMMTTSPKIFTPADTRTYERVENSVRLARYGCDCYAYCMIAAGQIDLVMEAGLKAYDIAALIPVIENAGGIVTDWQGKSVDVLNIGNGQILAAGCAEIHREALKTINA